MEGLQLLAVDGTAFRVPDSVENRRFFGQHTNQHNSIASCRLLAWFDILNDLIVGVSFLDQHTYKTAHFDWLYQRRWRVETCFDRLKNQLMLGSFSAYRLHFVWQDIWCSLIYHNLCSAYLRTAQKIKDLKVRPHNKLDYLINRNIASGILRLYLPSLLMPAKAPRGDPLYPMLEQMSEFAEAYRPNRKSPRKRKMMRINDRHQTEKNYKRASIS